MSNSYCCPTVSNTGRHNMRLDQALLTGPQYGFIG